MDNFPKKYNSSIVIQKNDTKNKGDSKGLEIFSPGLPLDQKLTPGSIFFLHYKDMFCKTNEIIGEYKNNIIGYTVSSIYHSSLDTTKSNLPKIQLLKSLQKNLSFLGNLGLNIKHTKESFTMSERFCNYIRGIFSNFFYDKKIIYKQNTINWSKLYQTDITNLDTIQQNVQVPKYTIKYFIGTKGQAINIVTTRIETIFADVAIAVNPIDKRYKKLIGQNVIIPIINKSIPIIGDESVDVFSGEGAIRVTPGHDKYGLEIAQKHGLPTNIFAIDTNGKFTEHAGEFSGKDVGEFLDNIIKFVDDIGNMENNIMVEEPRYFDKNTGEELFPISLNQWLLTYDYALDYLSNYLQSKNLEDIFEKNNIYSISNRSSKGILIPVVSNKEGKMFPIDDRTIIDIYGQKKTKKDIAMTLIILNLILDNNLSPVFSLHELIDSLFSKNFLGNNTKIGEYLDMYTELGQENPLYKNGLKSIYKLVEKIDKNIENIELLLDILKNSFAINIDNDEISINYHDIFSVSGLTLQTQDSFNKNFIDSCLPLFMLGCEHSNRAYSEIATENRAFMSTKDEYPLFINTNLLSLQYSKRLIFSDFLKSPVLVDIKGEKINNYNSKYYIKDYYQNLKKYGSDTMRLNILFSEHQEDNTNKLIFDTYSTHHYNLLLNKFWNANRYIFGKYENKFALGTINLGDIVQHINKYENITDYDNWVLHNLKIILDDFNYQLSEGNILTFGKKLIENYSSLFCDKYINISKVINNENTYIIMLFVGIIYLDLLYPYIPNFISQIKSKFLVNYQGLNIQDINFTIKDKNYKINIFIDVIDKINNLRQKISIKKHEFIDVYIQANPDFLNFLKENETVFRLLTRVQKINLLGFHEVIPNECEVDNVINISVGVKKPDSLTVEARGDILKNIEKEYHEKIDHIQHLKSIFSSIYGNADSNLVEKKRQEISDLQSEIENLEFKISKLKLNN